MSQTLEYLALGLICRTVSDLRVGLPIPLIDMGRAGVHNSDVTLVGYFDVVWYGSFVELVRCGLIV